MTSSFRPSLVAAFVACVALAAPAQAQFDIFHRQAPPPADIPGGAREIPTTPLGWWCASTGSRKNFARPTAGSRNCRTRSIGSRRCCRSSARMLNSGSAIAPVARRRTRTSPKRPWLPTSRPSLQGQDDRTHSIPTPIQTRPARRGRWERLRRAPRSCANRRRPWRASSLPPALPSNSAKDRRPPHSRADRRSSAPGSRCSISRVSSINAALQAFQAGQYPEAETGFKAFLAANPAHRLTSGRDLLHRRDLSSTLASPRGGRTISQGHDRLFQIVAGAGKHGAARADARRAWQFRAGLRDADRIRQALPDRVGLGEEAR